VKRVFRSAVFALLRFSGLPFLARELLQRRTVTIVVYHAPPAELADLHFGALRRRYHIISLSEYLAARIKRTADRLPAKALIITFDDGHRSNYELRTLLEKHRIPITIFLCSGIVGTQRHYWWFHAQDPAEAQSLKALPDQQRVEALQGKGHSDTREYETRQSLSRSEITEMKGAVDFQSHTVFHPILPACSDEKAAREIAESKQTLEGEHGLRIYALAYPNGDYSEREIRLLRKAGYTCGLTLDAGFNDSKTDLFCLRRVPLPDDAGLNELLVKTSGLWGYLQALGAKVRRSGRRVPAPLDGQDKLPTAVPDGQSA